MKFQADKLYPKVKRSISYAIDKATCSAWLTGIGNDMTVIIRRDIYLISAISSKSSYLQYNTANL